MAECGGQCKFRNVFALRQLLASNKTRISEDVKVL